MLPPEILSEILIHSDIDDVSNFCRLNKNNVCDNQFWIKKFKQDDLLLPSDYNEIQNLNIWVKSYKRSQIYTKVYKNLQSGIKYRLEFNDDESNSYPILSQRYIIRRYNFYKMYVDITSVDFADYRTNNNPETITDFIQLFPYKEIIKIDNMIVIKNKEESVLTTIYNTLAYYY